MGILGQNLRFAVRQLWRNPGFTGTVILTLALSIGANTAIFCVVNTFLLNSLPDAECFCYARGDATIQTRYASFPYAGSYSTTSLKEEQCSQSPETCSGRAGAPGTSGPYCPA